MILPTSRPGQAQRGTVWAIIPLAAVTALVVVPVIAVVIAGLNAQSLSEFTDSTTWRIVAYTAFQALVSTALSIGLAMPAAYALYRLSMPGRRTLLAVLTLPFILPTVVVGLAFRELLPFPGTTAAIVIAHVFFNVGLAVRVIGSLWGHLDPRMREVASTLGLTPIHAFVRVTLPPLTPAILSAAILIFLFTFTSFVYSFLI